MYTHVSVKIRCERNIPGRVGDKIKYFQRKVIHTCHTAMYLDTGYKYSIFLRSYYGKQNVERGINYVRNFFEMLFMSSS